MITARLYPDSTPLHLPKPEQPSPKPAFRIPKDGLRPRPNDAGRPKPPKPEHPVSPMKPPVKR